MIYYLTISDAYEVIQVLLENGADVSGCGFMYYSRKDSTGQWIIGHYCLTEGGYGALDDIFPLFLCSSYQNEKILKVLLSAGADVNQKTAIGQTALHALCTTHGSSFRVEKFSLHDDDPPNSTTALVKLLLDYGADVNICDNFGKSPLHYSASCRNRHFSQILIQNGANVFLEDKNGLTALDYAADQDYPLTMALIDKYNFPTEQVIQAYECVAFHAPSPSELLKKATLLRKEHGIPKKILPPVECYGFEKEWETIEKLEEFVDDEFQVLLACILARERISQEKGFDVAERAISKCKWC